MRAAIYARYSSHHQREESIEIQVERSQAYCDEHGYSVACVYADRAASGKSANRAEFARMMEDAKRGRFDVVVVWKATRIMRNRDEMAITRFKLRQCGVSIEYAGESLPDGASGELMLAMLEAMAEYESSLMGERVADGMRKSAEACRACGLRIFGYSVDGDDMFQVEESEAAAVRMAFDMAASGQPIAEVVRALSPWRTRRGNRFGFQAVKDMLTRPCYRGVYRFAGVEVEGGMPAIVDDDTYWRVQKMVGEKRVRPRSTASYALTGKLLHSCGSPMVGVSGTGGNGKHCYYRCKGCGKTVRKDAMEGSVRDILGEALGDEASRRHIAALFMQYQAETRDTSRSDALRADLADVRARIGRVWDAIERGLPGGDERLDALRVRESELEAALEECGSQIEFTEADVMAFLEEFAGFATDAMAAPFVSSVVLDGDKVHCAFVFDGEPCEPSELGGSHGECSGSPEMSVGELAAYAIPHGVVIVGRCRPTSRQSRRAS